MLMAALPRVQVKEVGRLTVGSESALKARQKIAQCVSTWVRSKKDTSARGAAQIACFCGGEPLI